MDMALRQAQTAAEEGEVPVGAVIAHAGSVVGRGRNACERLQDPTAHAEMLAITAASETLGSWRLEHCTLYCTLEPCPMCMGACLNARIARVVYAAREPKAGACGSVVDLAAPPGFNHALEVIGGVGEQRAAWIMKEFFAAMRQRNKRKRELGD